jgi:hypothetical protein
MVLFDGGGFFAKLLLSERGTLQTVGWFKAYHVNSLHRSTCKDFCKGNTAQISGKPLHRFPIS